MNVGVARVRVLDKSHLGEIRNRDGIDLSEEKYYPFPAEISSTLLDTYATEMAESSLRNFVNEARDGVAFLEGHKGSTLPLGHSYDARMESMTDRQRVVADIYTVRGVDLNILTYASTNGFIEMLQTRVVRDVSIGFYGGLWRCSICGKDVFDFSNYDDYCRHWPGREYEIDGEKVMARATIEDAHLSEISAVYDGATPEAKILRKAKDFVRLGHLDEKAVFGLNNLYNLRMSPRDWDEFGSQKRSISMSVVEMLRNAKIEGYPSDAEEEAGVKWVLDRCQTLKDEISGLEQRITELQEAEGSSDAELTEALSNVRSDLKKRQEEVAKLTELREVDKDARNQLTVLEKDNADLKERVTNLETDLEGANSRAESADELKGELVTHILEEGVRAYGDGFDEETQKELLENASLPTLRKTLEKYREAAAKRFPNGRKTQSGGGDPDGDKATPKTRRAPDLVFGLTESQ